MKRIRIVSCRLSRQHIAGSTLEKPEDAVRALCALQAQDYEGALWSVGLRTRNATYQTVRKAIGTGRIVRTWLVRGTLHFTAPEDIRWILSLTAERTIAGAAGRHRQLGLTEDDYSQSRKLFISELQGGRQLTRDEIYQVLEKNGISPEGQRGYHLVWKAGLEGIICFGPPRGTRPTFVLLDDWAPEGPVLPPHEALAKLAVQYFSGHGPATLQDFVWWSGLKVSDAKAGITSAGAALTAMKSNGTDYFIVGQESFSHASTEQTAYLLPGFDEFIVGYRDRSAVFGPEVAGLGMAGSNGMMLPVVIIDGVVAGTWKRHAGKKDITVTLKTFPDLSPARQRLAEAAAERYGRFMELPVTVR